MYSQQEKYLQYRFNVYEELKRYYEEETGKPHLRKEYPLCEPFIISGFQQSKYIVSVVRNILDSKVYIPQRKLGTC